MNRNRVTLFVGTVFVVLGATNNTLQALDNLSVADFDEELCHADVVVRGTVAEIRWEGCLTHAFVQEVVFKVQERYKGDYPESEMDLYLNLPTVLHHPNGPRPPLSANVGDELIVPIKAVKRLTAKKDKDAPVRARHYYTAPAYYPVRESRVSGSPYPFAEDMQAHADVAKFESLIRSIVSRPPPKTVEYVPSKVLFYDDFDDGSFAGWTFLVGARDGSLDDFYGEKWVGPGLQWRNEYPEEQRGTRGKLARDSETGNYEGTLDGAKLQLGVYDGRLRLRCSRLWHHITVVAGDPEWTDYEVECDIWNRVDRLIDQPTVIAQALYLEFGIYGRVRVPNMPETTGEHSFLSVEFGPYSQEMLMVPMWGRVPTSATLWHNFLQIRAKLPDADGGRETSFWRKNTKFLDLATHKVPQDTKIHLKARFMGDRVEGYVDGVKLVSGRMSSMPDFMTRGRMALWTFETWAEFDNVKVTELVRKTPTE